MRKIVLFFMMFVFLCLVYGYSKADEENHLVNKAYIPFVSMPNDNPSGGVFVFDNQFVKIRTGYMLIYAEIFNGTDMNLYAYSLPVNIYDASGHLLDVGTAYMHVNDLRPNEKTCIVAWFDFYEDYSYYSFEPQVTYFNDNTTVLDVSLFDVYGSYDNFNWFRVTGQLKNNSAVTARVSHIIATVYNEQGNVVDCNDVYPITYELSSGQVTSFVMNGEDYGDYVNYRLQAGLTLP